MANVQHSGLSDPYLHEPKGVSTASANQLYLSNGSGSGTWTNANRFSGTGWGRYTNTTYVGTTVLPISTSEVLVPFTTNDTVTQLPTNYSGTTSSLFDLANEKLLFVNVGDLHSITFNYKIYSTSGSPSYMNIIMYGSSDGITYGTVLGDTTVSTLKGAGQVVTSSALFPVTSDMVTHGAKIYMVANTGTLNVIDIGLTTARVHRARS